MVAALQHSLILPRTLIPMKKLFLLLSLFTCVYTYGQSRPKLVVGIVVDQMRWDYLYRFYDRYGNDGLKKLMREGFSCENTFIPYAPTVTAAGHASVYTGSVPALNGILSNSWYDRELKRWMYCVEDASVETVGSSSTAGKMSPRNLWSNTITDELRLATNFRSKTIAVALKDRGAILPGGHASNGSYWFDNASGGWITSTFYMQELPQWVKDLNGKKLPDAYMQRNWNTLYPISSYKQSTVDSNAYEGRLGGEDMTFPHMTSQIGGAAKYESFRTTPFGNSYTIDMAKAAIEGENLGGRSVTDFLAVSFSSPDYIGHTFGPNSIEVEDNYLRLDQDLASFIKYLDTRIGKGQYLIFLTADHAVAHNPLFLKDHKLPSGNLEENMRRRLNDSLQKNFNAANLIEQYSNSQYFLNYEVIRQQKISAADVKQYIISFLLKQPGIANAIDLQQLNNVPLPDRVKLMLKNGYNQKNGGDIHVIMKPQYFENVRTGSTHGVWNPYDARIPLIWYGWNIKKGKSNREVYMTDIAPTVAALLNIQIPNASIGTVITEVTSPPLLKP